MPTPTLTSYEKSHSALLALFTCAVRNATFRCLLQLCCRQGAPRDSLLRSAQEHLDLIKQEQMSRKGYPAESAELLYADVCMSLAEGSVVAKGWARDSYREV